MQSILVTAAHDYLMSVSTPGRSRALALFSRAARALCASVLRKGVGLKPSDRKQRCIALDLEYDT
jgi:hypothetical protein